MARSFTKRESSLRIVPESKDITPIVGGIGNIKGIKEEVAKFEIYGTTVVNLLGINGNFEDANTLQNGWITTNTTNSKTTGVFGTKTQKCVATSTDGQHYIYYGMSSYAVTGHKYFFCAYVKTANGKCRLYTQYRNSAGDLITSASASNNFSNTNFIKMYGTQEILSMYSTPTFNFFFAIVKADNTATYPGTNEEINVDGAMVVDLTNMGNLPAPLRKFFSNSSYTTWASLATTSNITADGRTQTGEAWLSELLPFVDSVATVGWNYSSGTVTTTVENRGENLFKAQEFKDFINTYDSTALYFKDEGYDVVEFKNDLGSTTVFMKGKFKQNTQYTLKVTGKTSIAGNILYIRYVYTDGTTYSLQFTNTFYERKTLVSTPGKTIDYLNIPYGTGSRFIALNDFMIYEGTTSKAYAQATENKISFSTELVGWQGIYDQIGADGKIIKRWHSMVVAYTSGNVTLPFSGTGTAIMCQTSGTATGQIYFGTCVGTTLSVSNLETGANFKIFYQLTTPVITNLGVTLPVYLGQNNILISDPLASANVEYTQLTNTSEILAFAEDFNVSSNNTYQEKKSFYGKTTQQIKTGETYKISMSNPFFDKNFDDKQLNDTGFTIEESLTNEDDGTTATYQYHGCKINSISRDESANIVYKIDISAESKEVL